MTTTQPRLLLAAAALASTLALAGSASAQPPPQVPSTAPATSAGSEELPDYDRARPNRTMLITGASLFGGTYALSAVVGAAAGNDVDRRLLIPVIGPWLDLGDRQCDRRNCQYEGGNKTALVTSGVLQGVGFATLIASFFVKDSRVVPHYESNQAKVWVLPTSSPGSGYGMAALGTF